MKNFKKILTISGVFLVTILFTSTVNAANKAKVTSETVRIRKEASTESSVVELISMNEEVEILGEKEDWYKIKYKNVTGYIKSNLLSVEGEDVKESTVETSSEDIQTESQENQEEINVELSKDQEITTTSEIKLKIVPLINSSDIITINSNTKVVVKDIINDWAYVESDSSFGWTRKSILEDMVKPNTENEEKKPAEEDKVKDEEPEEKVEQKQETEEKEQTSSKIGYVKSNTVNLRKEMSTSSTILDSLPRNTQVKILSEKNGWSQVEISGKKGYIASEYLSDKKVEVETTSRGTDEPRTPLEQPIETTQKTEDEKQTQTSQNTNKVTTTTTTSSSNNNESKTSTDTSTDKTNSNNDKSQTQASENKSESTSATTTTNKGNDVVAYAKKYLGYKYVSGGASPSTGFDCSGFTTYVFKHFGISLNRTSSGQRSNGKAVNKSDLQPGDIVCFTGHVGIYIGGNQFIHAANPKKGVIITSMSDSYYVRNYITARRVL